MVQYRIMVNVAIRAGLSHNATSRASLSRLVYRDLSRQNKGLSAYVIQAIGDAASILRVHRKRVRAGRPSRPPYVTRLFLKIAPSSFHLDAFTGDLRLSVGNGAWVMFRLPISDWHRAQLKDPVAHPVLLTIKPGKVVLALSKDAPAPYQPEGVLALDTNEQSLDGVLAGRDGAQWARVPLGDVRAVQHRHFVRRQRLAAKKARDARLKRHLLGREGRREHHRVTQRLHLISKGLVEAAKQRKAAVVLEDLTGIRRFFSPRLNRRLSSWPHRELHRQIAYKALAAGVPVLFVNPYNTSKKCAICGWTPKQSKTRTSARRPDGMFACLNAACGWKADRQMNAGLNILQTALANEAGLGGIRFSLDVLSGDAMNLLHEPARAARGERKERESLDAAMMRRGYLTDRHGTAHAANR